MWASIVACDSRKHAIAEIEGRHPFPDRLAVQRNPLRIAQDAEVGELEVEPAGRMPSNSMNIFLPALEAGNRNACDPKPHRSADRECLPKRQSFISGVGRRDPLPPGVVEAGLVSPLRVAHQKLLVDVVFHAARPGLGMAESGQEKRLERTRRGKW